MAPMENVDILAFDVFGTVVDWHGSIAREVEALGLGVDGGEFARAWRAGYQPAMQRVRSGAQGWTRLDDLHRGILEEVLARFGITALSEADKRELNRAWHRLTPWPEAVAGLTRLRRRYTLCTLSNGNLGLLANMAKHAGLPWDCILSAEVFRRYKPHPDTYLGVARIFDRPPGAVMMVAAHQEDLDSARKLGLRTAYIERPFEFGEDAPKAVSGSAANDRHATSLLDLATQLGC